MRPCKYLMDISPYPPLCDNPVRYYGGGATEARCSGCEWYEDAIAATAGRSCASCPEMDNPDSYINHIQAALKWHDEHVPRPTNPRNTCVVLQGEKPPEEVMFVREGGGVTHYQPERAVGNRTDLARQLREVYGLDAFVELFGYSWEDNSIWTWHDVACAMADAVDAMTVGNVQKPSDAVIERIERFCTDYAQCLVDSTIIGKRNHEFIDRIAVEKAEVAEADLIRELAEDIAMAGVGTCRNIAELNRGGVSGFFFVCSECGLAVHADRDINKTNYTCRKPDGSIDLRTFNSGGEYKFERCPHCGRKVTE